MSVSRQGANIDWKSLDGAFDKPRRLHLQANNEKLFRCPASNCEHNGFASRRGCRKHIAIKHPWYKYFDEKPLISNVNSIKLDAKEQSSSGSKPTLPCCATNSELGCTFLVWLQSTTGGEKNAKQANISVTQAFKFLKYCCEQSGEDEKTVLSTVELVDYFLCSSKFLTDFLDHLETTWQMGQPGRLGYVTGIADLLDFRRFHSPPGPVLQNFSVTEVYIKRARQCLAKQIRSHWTTDLDIDSLESRRSWATLAELQTVIPFHIERYQKILKMCRKQSTLVTSMDLTFATRFLAVFMFVKVKGCRPMTYQHLTVKMFENAKGNGGMVDQRIFKTAQSYGFNSLYFDDVSFEIIDDYVQFVRPLLKPQCEYLLVNRNGAQFQRLTDLLSVLVFQAIGKYIHPTRYRQIIETESVNNLDLKEQRLVSEDQKHSSNVARVHYQKLRSRDIALKGRSCMKKLRGDQGRAMDVCLQQLRRRNPRVIEIEDDDSDNDSACVTGDDRPVQNDKFAWKTKRAVRFTKEEDDYLRKGLQKFGLHWTSILQCPLYNFHECRGARTLRMRAITLKLI